MSYRIRVVPEVEVWLGELRDNDPDAANILDEAVDALREGGAGLGPPLVVPVEAPAQDTHPDLDRAYQQQLKKLTRLRRAVADAANSRKRVKLQIEQLEGQAAGLGEQRGQALETGDDELAAFFRTRQSFVADQLADLHPRYADLRAGEERLTAAAAKLELDANAVRQHATPPAQQSALALNELRPGAPGWSGLSRPVRGGAARYRGARGRGDRT